MPWSNNDNNQNENPWGNRGSNGGGGNQTPPDLDEVIRRLQERFGGFFGRVAGQSHTLSIAIGDRCERSPIMSDQRLAA